MINFKILSLLLFVLILNLNSCGFYKRSDVADNPVNVDDRVKKNIQEGRGIRFGKGATRGGDFDFLHQTLYGSFQLKYLILYH